MATAPACRSAVNSLTVGRRPTRTIWNLSVRLTASATWPKSAKVHEPPMADLSSTRKSTGAAASARQAASSGSSGMRSPWVMPGWATLTASTKAPTGGDTIKSAPAPCHTATFEGVSGTPPAPQMRRPTSGSKSGERPGEAMTTASAASPAAASAASKSPEQRAIRAMAGKRLDCVAPNPSDGAPPWSMRSIKLRSWVIGSPRQTGRGE